MTTDELILQLTKSAVPVRPLPSPSVRLLRWVAVATMLGAVAVIAIGPRADLSTAISHWAFVASLLALLIAMVSAGAAALIMSVPGAERSPRNRVLPIAAAVAWVLAYFLRVDGWAVWLV